MLKNKLFVLIQLLQIFLQVYSHKILDGECPNFPIVENLNWKKVGF